MRSRIRATPVPAPASPKSANEPRIPPLVSAVRRGNQRLVEALLATGEETERRYGGEGKTALHWAAERGLEGCVRALVQAGANTEARTVDKFGRAHATPLMLAAWAGQAGCVKALLAGGARVDPMSRSALTDSAMSGAVSRGHGECVKILAEAGASIDAQPRFPPMLHWAARHGQESSIRALVELGADLEAKDTLGNTALADCAYHGKFEGVRILARMGAKLDAANPEGLTPAMLAEAREHYELRAWLLGARSAMEQQEALDQGVGQGAAGSRRKGPRV